MKRCTVNKLHDTCDAGNRYILAIAVHRHGKVLVLLAILLPSVLGIAGFVIDGGLMMDGRRNLQHAADAAATAAAMDLRQGKSSSVAENTAKDLVRIGNGFSDASVTINIPPMTGAFTGLPRHVEVIVEAQYESRIMQVLDGVVDRTLQARSVAGVQDATSGAAIVVLDPDPSDLEYPTADELAATIDQVNIADDAAAQLGVTDFLSSVPVVGSLAAQLINSQVSALLPEIVENLVNDIVSELPSTALPTLTAGLEIEGIGRLIVDGAVHVNNEWGGVDENGDLAGSAAGPPYGIACMPILPTTRVRARDIRVVGGVDNEELYQPFDSDEQNPLQANRLPVPDPFEGLPSPSTASDSSNVSPIVHNPADAVRVAVPTADATALIADVLGSLPPLVQSLFQPLMDPLNELLSQPILEPGVYDSITVLSPIGGARFEPGVYIIRGTNESTRLSLCILGPVQANGVLFYITDSANYNASTGTPDSNDDTENPPPNPLLSLLPSTLIAPLLPTAEISGLNDIGSPFHGMLIYQRAHDRRPIVIEAQQLIGSGNISGTVYSKWGHTVFVGGAGSYDLRFVTGTMRVLTVTDTTIAPTTLLPAASDVYLLE